MELGQNTRSNDRPDAITEQTPRQLSVRPGIPNEIALERFKIISPILTALDERADKGKIGLMKSEACGLAGVSRKTLNRWLSRYTESGFDGLKYQSPETAPKRLIPGDLIKEAVMLRLEVPSRSVGAVNRNT